MDQGSTCEDVQRDLCQGIAECLGENTGNQETLFVSCATSRNSGAGLHEFDLCPGTRESILGELRPALEGSNTWSRRWTFFPS